jgi:predicted nucleotidyltransferase
LDIFFLSISDLDYKGVWAAPAERFLGLLLPSESISCHSNPSANDPDITLYEAKHFCDLLLSSDPFALEMLFTDKYCYATEVWSELKSFRRDFLTVNAVDRYVFKFQTVDWLAVVIPPSLKVSFLLQKHAGQVQKALRE